MPTATPVPHFAGLTSLSVLGRKIEVVDLSPSIYEAAFKVQGPRASYDLISIGGGLLQPRNSNRVYCSIAGNYFFWVTKAGVMSCGTRDQFDWSRYADARISK